MFVAFLFFLRNDNMFLEKYKYGTPPPNCSFHSPQHTLEIDQPSQSLSITLKTLKTLKMHLSIVSAILFLAGKAFGACECGFIDEGGRTWMDALVIPLDKVGDLSKSQDLFIPDYLHQKGFGNYSYRLDPKNVFTDKEGNLNLQVHPPVNNIISSSEVATRRKDFLYGTFRSVIAFPPELGSCVGFFHYHNDTEEIDIEYIGQNPNILYVSSKQTNPIDFSPDIGSTNVLIPNLPNVFREYRFDWVPGQTEFFVDGKKVSTLKESPSLPGRVIMMNWSSGDGDWSETPRTIITAKFQKFNMFFNSSHEFIVNKYSNACEKATSTGSKDAYCLVSNMPLDKVYGYDQNVLRTSSASGTNLGDASAGYSVRPFTSVWSCLIVAIVLIWNM